MLDSWRLKKRVSKIEYELSLDGYNRFAFSGWIKPTCILDYQYTSTPVYWYGDILVYLYTDIVVCWHTNIRVDQYTGWLVG